MVGVWRCVGYVQALWNLCVVSTVSLGHVINRSSSTGDWKNDDLVNVLDLRGLHSLTTELNLEHLKQSSGSSV